MNHHGKVPMCLHIISVLNVGCGCTHLSEAVLTRIHNFVFNRNKETVAFLSENCQYSVKLQYITLFYIAVLR